jgi:hypothetical protein
MMHRIPKQGEKPNNTSKPSAVEKVTMEQEAADYNAGKLEREMRKLDTSWYPTDKPLMYRPTVIETKDDGTEKAREIHFVFNTELMTEHGNPTSFKEAMKGQDADKWLQASAGDEAMHFMKQGSWRKKLRSEVNAEGRKIIGTKWVLQD